MDPTGDIDCQKAGQGPTLGVFVYGEVTVYRMFGIDDGYNGQAGCDQSLDPSIYSPIYPTIDVNGIPTPTAIFERCN